MATEGIIVDLDTLNAKQLAKEFKATGKGVKSKDPIVKTEALGKLSNVRYYSFKELELKGTVPFLYVLLIVILFVSVAMNPSVVLSFSFMFYVLSGPLQTLIALQRVRKHRHRLPKKNKVK